MLLRIYKVLFHTTRIVKVFLCINKSKIVRILRFFDFIIKRLQFLLGSSSVAQQKSQQFSDLSTHDQIYLARYELALDM